MYEAYFNFTRRPFASIPQADQFFPADAIENARARLARCIERGEGVGMVVGPSGTGKTLLCQVLKEQFREKYDVVLLCSGRLSTRSALFQSILYGLGRPYRQMTEGELRIALTEYLVGEDADAEEDARREALVLLVDEAHTLPLRLLEEIRMLTNLAQDGLPKVRLVLCGGSILEERFASPRLESFSQRLVARCYLESFNRAETQEYLCRRIDAVAAEGCVDGESFFDVKTAQAIYQATDGVPRLVNQVCDHALLLAYSGGRKQLRPRDIEEAWADLQQLPTPWSDEDADGACGRDPEHAGGDGIVQFGGLDDEDDDLGGHDLGEECETPAIHIAATDDADDICPIKRIEQTLSDLDGGSTDGGYSDESFEPAGAIVPEVELTFGVVGNPFEEDFEEEEVVVSRYSQTQGKETPSNVSVARIQRPQYRELHDDEESCSESCRSGISPLVGGSPLTLPIHRERAAVSVEMEKAEKSVDRDMIPIDDNLEQSSDERPRFAVARKSQYNQLFAKLRRG
ncbi:MAG: AAA family ATPase [Planctomycetota bacterium]|nr:AAA family ATPase [Planctomycetota bacterium]